MSIREIVIGVTGINASDGPAPGIGVAKSLKAYNEFDAQIVGLVYDVVDSSLQIDWYLDKIFKLPYPVAGHERLIKQLRAVKERIGLDVVVPTLESELAFYIEAKEALKEIGIEVLLPRKVQLDLRDKKKLPEIAHLIGAKAPTQEIIYSAVELYNATERMGYPLLIKGGADAEYQAEDLQEAVSGFSKAVAEWGYPVIVQSMVSGKEVSLVGLADGKGELLGSVTVGTVASDSDASRSIETVLEDSPLVDAAKAFASATGWRGVFELKCLVNEWHIYLMSVAAGFSDWIYKATTAGDNLPAMLVEQALDNLEETTEGYPASLRMDYINELFLRMDHSQPLELMGEVA